LPLPPVSAFAPAEPVIEMPDDSADASTFWKLLTETASPLVWSRLPRLTVVTRAQQQRIGAGAAVDRHFGIVGRTPCRCPAPALRISAPPPPSIVSLPAPVVITFALDEPVTASAVATTDASRFSKFLTLTVSPVVWSEPAATEKSTAVIPPDAARIRVSVPVAAVDRGSVP